ncbi:carbon-nitrogen hydrolase family protein [Candidatus Dependentiae bacterium]|nr:carbon-nitrogen hydrolase family protein [Candidatus Dependentiae bacterium]
MKKIVAAGIQISVEPNNIPKNIEKCMEWYNKAVKEVKPDLIVFPETITTGFNPGMPVDQFYSLLPKNINDVLSHFVTMSSKTKSYCVVPTYQRGPKKNIIYNSAFIIGPKEGVIGVYSKTHPFPLERLSGGGWTTQGYDIPVFDTAFGKIGMIICYDGDFPELSRILAIKGASVIARPSALLRSYEIWEMTNMARAYDNHVYMVSVNAVGQDASKCYYFGHSMIVSPIAQKLALGRGAEEIIFAELDPDPIKKITYGSNSPMLFDHLQDRNIKSYKNYLTKKAVSTFEPSKRIPY